MLDYYLKLNSAHNIIISYMMQLYLQIYFCNIIVLTYSKSINHSFYIWIYWNQVNWSWVKITNYWILKVTIQLISYLVTVYNSSTYGLSSHEICHIIHPHIVVDHHHITASRFSNSNFLYTSCLFSFYRIATS